MVLYQKTIRNMKLKLFFQNHIRKKRFRETKSKKSNRKLHFRRLIF